MKLIAISLFVLMLIGVLSTTIVAQSVDDITPISPENVTQVTQLARLGRGSATHLDWHPNGEIVAFGDGRGVWLLNEAFEEVAHFPDIPHTQDIAWNPSKNILATLHLSEIQFWRISDDFSTAVLEHVMPVNEAEWWYHDTVLDRCMVWSDDGLTLGVGTPPVRERIADEQPIPNALRRLELYNVQSGALIEIRDANLERRVSARCRHGAVTPDGSLETYLKYGYQAGFHFVRMMFASDLMSEPVAEFTQGLSEVYTTDWHPSGAYITMIHQFTLQNLTWPELVLRENTPFFSGPISSLEWLSDTKMLLGGSKYTQVDYLWSQEAESAAYNPIPLVVDGKTIEAAISQPLDSPMPLRITRTDIPDPIHETRVQYDLTVLDLDSSESLSFHPDIPAPNASICDGNGCKTFVQALHPNRQLAALNIRGGIQFWSLEDGSLLHTVSTERDVASLTWDAEGKRLATGSMDGTVYVLGIP